MPVYAAREIGRLMKLVIRLLVMMVVIALAPRVLDGVRVDGLGSALIAAVVYALLAVAIGWLVRFVVAVLSIVPGVLTFGLFFLLVPMIANAVLLKLTSGVLASFEIRTWTAALLLGIVLGLVDTLFDRMARDPRR
jgi:putative membrane protein